MLPCNLFIKDYEKRVNLYYNHKFINIYENVERDVIPNYDKLLKHYNAYKDDYKPYRAWYHKLIEDMMTIDASLRKKFKNRVSFKTLCWLVSMEDDYKKVYSSTSNSVHSTNVTEHLFLVEGKFTIVPIAKRKKVFSAAATTLIYIDEIITTIFKNSSNKDADKIINYSNQFIDQITRIATYYEK